MNTLLWLIPIVVLVLLVCNLQRHFFFMQYLFFCRFPLLLSLMLLVMMPWAMLGFAEGTVGNLAVLGFWDIVLVALLTTWVAWAVMFASARLLEWIPFKAKLPFVHKTVQGKAWERTLPLPRRLWRLLHMLPLRLTEWFYWTTLGLPRSSTSSESSPTDRRRDKILKNMRPTRLVLYLSVALVLIAVVVWKSTARAEEGDINLYGRSLSTLALNSLAAAIGIGIALVLRLFSAIVAGGFQWFAGRLRWMLNPVGWAASYAMRPVQYASKKGYKWAHGVAPGVVGKVGAFTSKNVAQVRQWVDPRRNYERVCHMVADMDPRKSGFTELPHLATPKGLVSRTSQGFGFLIIAAVLYGIGYLWFHPLRTDSGASILLILALLMVLCFLMTLVAAFLDALRLGVLLVVVAGSFATYELFDIDHYYPVKVAPMAVTHDVAADTGDRMAARAMLTPQQVYAVWREKHDQKGYPTMVVVTASGGGITAAFWTAEVLTLLQAASPKFGESMVMISTVSGGGVGGMYFVDAYRGGKPPSTTEDFDRIKNAAGASSLLATAWGFVYRDIWMALPWLDKSIDRGWALEQTWVQRLRDRDATLRRWARDVSNGERPVQVFNATATETGERFLLTPMSISGPPAWRQLKDPCADPVGEGQTGEQEGREQSKGGAAQVAREAGDLGKRPRDEATSSRWQAKNFLDFYRDADLSVATAARLSATFPFVSPIARPDPSVIEQGSGNDDEQAGPKGGDDVAALGQNSNRRVRIPDCYAYHLADGGYYDNHGVVTAIDFLRDVLPLYKAPPGPSGKPRVLIVQIRAAKTVDDRVEGGHGFRHAVLGPIFTLLNVRTTTQISRNDVEIELLKEAWVDRIEVVSWIFNLGDVDAPLSWHLTTADKEAIEAGWTAEHQEQLEQIKVMVEGATQSVVGLCCEALPTHHSRRSENAQLPQQEVRHDT